MSSTARHALLAAVVLVIGTATAFLLASSREAPVREQSRTQPPLVDVETLERHDVEVRIPGYGSVTPHQRIQLVPQVSGRVIWVNPNVSSGGYVDKGDQLVRIDPSDYELAVQRSHAEVKRAEVALQRQKAESEIAQMEWNQTNPGQSPPNMLVTGEAQVQEAQAQWAAARAALRTAELNLERTRIYAPFNGRIESESVDLGQSVSPGQSIAVLYGTDTVEVEVALDDRQLRWFRMGRFDAAGSPATVSSTFAGGTHSWQGSVARTKGVDRQTGLVTVVVEVADPFEASTTRPPLQPGMFVDVAIHGQTLESVFSIPRHAVRRNDTVWVVQDDRIHFRRLDILYTGREHVHVKSGLSEQDQIVTSKLDTVSEGMAVRVSSSATDDTKAGES